MDLDDTPEIARFRTDVRHWLDANLPADWRGREPEDQAERFAFRRAWQSRLHAGGWCGMAWPREHGGRGASYLEQVVLNEELARARAPVIANYIAVHMAGPTIIAYGTEAQKQRYLSRILSAEEIWCQCFSEPDAGSDLAAVRTRAIPDGDGWVLTGQKVWTTFAQYADRAMVLARTDPTLPKHAGLTYFLVDMHAPGISVRPLTQLTGEAEFNEVFFDAVRVPHGHVLGEVNDGWRVALTTLMFERGTLTFSRNVGLSIDFARVVRLARRVRRRGRPAIEDPAVRQRLAALYVRLCALRYMGYRSVSETAATGVPGPTGSMERLWWSELNQDLQATALWLLGPHGQLLGGSPEAVEDGAWQRAFLRSRSDTIAAGTAEIQRNIIAQRVLGLPRSY